MTNHFSTSIKAIVLIQEVVGSAASLKPTHQLFLFGMTTTLLELGFLEKAVNNSKPLQIQPVKCQ